MEISQVLAILNKTAKVSDNQVQKLQRWRDVYYGISLHTSGACPSFRDPESGRSITPPGYFGKEYQYLFDYFLLSRHPRESEAIRNWRYSQYKPLTKSPFSQAMDIIAGAIFQDSNFTFEISDKDDYDYVWSNKFEGNTLIGYFANVGFKHMIEDPNGIFVRIPSLPYYEQTDKVEVSVWFVNTKDIVFITEQDLLFKTADEAYYIDKETIWRFRYSKQEKKYFIHQSDKDGYYAHLLGKLPISIAGGEWNTQGYYDSFFTKAKAAADDFIASYSAAQLVDKEASHPYIVEASVDCPDCEADGHIQQDCESCPGGIERVKCNTCGGTHQISRNPGERLILPQESLKDGQPIQIINPDVGINKHHRETSKEILQMIIEALFLQRTEQAQSGVAKAIDQERLYKFISKISNRLFDNVITDTVRDISAYRHVVSNGGNITPAEYTFTIIKPTQFQIKTASDLLTEYAEGSKANLPVYIRQRMAIDFVDRQYSGDEVMRKKALVINQLDNISVLSIDEKLSLRAANGLSNYDLLYSSMLPGVLNDLINDKGETWFIEARIDDIKSLVDTKIKAQDSNNALMITALDALRLSNTKVPETPDTGTTMAFA